MSPSSSSLPPEASGAPHCALWLCVLMALLGASGAVAQSQPGWGGGVFVSGDVFEADRPTWHEERLVIQRRFARGAATLEGGLATRNGTSDLFVATDLYRTAGDRGYGNVRIQWAPEASGVPQWDLLGEAYATLGEGWDASVGARHLITDTNSATLALGSVAKYVGNWEVRARGIAPLEDLTTVSTSLAARYLLEGVGGLTASFAEMTVGQGREPVVQAGGVEVRQSWVVRGRFQREVRSGFGVSASLGYVWDDALTRWTGGLGVTGSF